MRQPGFYWVRMGDDWEIAEWSICWERIGDEIVREDSDFDEIDERRIERNPVITVRGEDLFAVITRYGNSGMTKEEIEEACKQTIPLNPPKYISDNPYLCKPDES